MAGQVKLEDPVQRAEVQRIQSRLDPEIPWFLTLMSKSRLMKLVIPLTVGAKIMPKENFEVTLLDDEGKEHIATYFHTNNNLGVGWSRFAKGHDLHEGDVVVVQLRKFNELKVYIVKKTRLAEVDGAPQPEACAEKSSLGNDMEGNVRTTGLAEVDGAFGHLQPGSIGKAGSDMKPMRKTVSGKHKRLPLSVNEGENENISPPQSVKRRFGGAFGRLLPEACALKSSSGNDMKGNVRTIAEVDGAFGRLQPEACAQKSSPGKAGALQPEACAQKSSPGKASALQPEACGHKSFLGSDTKDIGRKSGVAEVDALQPEACAHKSSLGKAGALQPEACAHKSSLGKAGSDMKPTRKTVLGKRKHLPLSVIEGGNENISPPQSVIDQPENCSNKVHLDYLKYIGTASSEPVFEEVKNIEDFTIFYNDMTLDYLMSAYTRSRYYDLCCSQNSFLHKTLLPGHNIHLVAGLISETVNIADAIKSSKVSSTSMGKFRVWKQSLESSKGYGMNVGFLLARLDELMKMASESDQAVDLSESKKSSSSKSGKEIKSKRSVKKKKMQ